MSAVNSSCCVNAALPIRSDFTVGVTWPEIMANNINFNVFKATTLDHIIICIEKCVCGDIMRRLLNDNTVWIISQAIVEWLLKYHIKDTRRTVRIHASDLRCYINLHRQSSFDVSLKCSMILSLKWILRFVAFLGKCIFI